MAPEVTGPNSGEQRDAVAVRLRVQGPELDTSRLLTKHATAYTTIRTTNSDFSPLSREGRTNLLAR
jgi:hypothetical protein